MSSSAFTPTTTQVTTEVPVNVPVVTAWQSYTPTFEGFGTPTSISAYWRRVGDSIEINGQFTSGSVTAALATISLPSGLNLDSTKLNGGQTNILGSMFRANSTVTSIPSGTRGPWTITESKTTSTSKVYVSTFTDLATAGVFQVQAGNALTASGEMLTFSFRTPISQWSSGVTTLADRALEEYAWNSDDGAGSNSSSFGYGSGGVLFPAITSTGATVTKRVRFNSEILPTDSISVEYQVSSTGPWRDAAQRFSNTQAGSSTYGLQILNVNLTDVEIQFGASGALQTGATYASAGELWNAYRSANWKWRVRKVSSGAQVGYPISTKNIVGATDGVAPVTGMLGERISASPASTVSFGATAAATQVSSLTLTPGTWLVSGMVRMSISGTAVAYFSGISSSPSSFDSLSFLSGASATVTGSTYVATPLRYVTVSQNTPYYLIGSINYSSLPSGGYNTESTIQAVRIA